MELSSWLGAFGTAWIDDLLVWAVAALAGGLGVVALVNAIEMFLESDAEAG